MVKHKGFTLIELLMAMAIVASLAIIPMYVIGNTGERSRDVIRQKDIKNYQSALEIYYSENGFFPNRTTNVTPSDPLPDGICTELGLSGKVCTKDPRSDGSTQDYFYITDASGLTYNLWVPLESSSDYFVVCSNGENGMVSSPITSSACPNF